MFDRHAPNPRRRAARSAIVLPWASISDLSHAGRLHRRIRDEPCVTKRVLAAAGEAVERTHRVCGGNHNGERHEKLSTLCSLS